MSSRHSLQRQKRSSASRAVLAGSCAAALLLGACGEPLEVRLPPANPALHGADGLGRLSKWALGVFLDVNTWVGAHAGYVAMFARGGRVVHAMTTGYADIESGQPMTLDTHFRIASMTKPVTAVAAMILVEDGRLDLDDPVERYIPAAGALRVATGRERGPDGRIPTEPLERPLKVRDLLTFSSGIGNADDPSDLGALWAERNIYAGTGSLEDRVNRMLTVPLYEQPGTTWRYGWSADVLARVAEVAAGEPLDRFMQRRIFGPLGMSSTRFMLHEGEREALARTYTQDESWNLIRVDAPRGDVVGWTAGGGGLVSTAEDYMRFALMLWNGGSYDGERVLSRETVELMTRPHVTKGVLEQWDIAGVGWGLGLAVVVDADATPMIDRDGDFWWSGYLGTIFWVSPETDLVSLVLAQNEPGPHSPFPYAIFFAPAFAFYGL